MIDQPSRMICWAAKWYGDDKVLFRGEFDFHARKLTDDARARMLSEVWSLLDQADIVVTYNGVKFDHKHLNTELLLSGYSPPRPYKVVDLYRIIKRDLMFESHSLDYVARRLGVGQKVETGGFDLWQRCMAGDRQAWADMRRYNEGDITVTEAVYDRLRGWMPGHPHVGTMAEGREMRCNQCGGTDLVRDGLYRAQQIDYVQFRCNGCGGMVRGSAHSRVANTRGARPL